MWRSFQILVPMGHVSVAQGSRGPIIMTANRQHALSDTSINAPTFNLLKGLLAFSLCFSHLVCLHLRVLLLAILLSTLIRFHAATSSLLPKYHCSIQPGQILFLFFIFFSALRCMLWTILVEIFWCFDCMSILAFRCCNL